MNQAVIFYDSECLMCSTFVKFIIKQDTHQCFQFASLLSDYAQKLELSKETVVVVDGKHTLTHQYAIRHIIQKLPKVKWVLFFFWITPNFIQRALYNFVAKNRKRVFGSTQCTLAQAHENRFIS